MGGMRGLLAGLTALALLVACGTERRPAARDDDDMPEISAAQLGDAFEDPATADFLAPEERTALDRVQAPRSPQTAGDHAGQDPAPPQGAVARALDDAGKVGIALLSVGATLGAFVAPFFLF